MLSLQAAAKREGIQEGIKEGRKEGKEEGLKEGLKEGILQIARNLKAAGMGQDEIIKLTSLTVEEVSALKSITPFFFMVGASHIFTS